MSEDPTRQMQNEEVLRRLNAIDSRLTNLETKIEERFYDTRPIWQQVLDQLNIITERLERMETEVKSIHRSLREVDRRLLRIEADVSAIKVKQLDLEDRVENFEGRLPPSQQS